MTMLTAPRVSTDRLTYEAATNEWIAEASDLPPLCRVSTSVADVGLTLVSAKTGREVTFVVSHQEIDSREGELLWTDLRPLNPDEWAAGTVRIFND